MKFLPSLLALTVAAAILPPIVASAGEAEQKMISQPITDTDYPFQKGVKDVELLDGFFFSFELNANRRPAYNYELTVLRLGWMFSNVHGTGFNRGNWEFLLDGFGGPFTQGQGTGLVGGGFLFRYNFVQPNTRWFPYVQFGGGGLYNDAFHHREQIVIGSGPEFNLETSAGVLYRIAKNWGANFEFGFRHISDAETSSRNSGVDSFGGLVGITYFY